MHGTYAYGSFASFIATTALGTFLQDILYQVGLPLSGQLSHGIIDSLCCGTRIYMNSCVGLYQTY